MKSLVLLAALIGCSSLVTDPCLNGFTQSGRACIGPHVVVDDARGSNDPDGPVTLHVPDGRIRGYDARPEGNPDASDASAPDADGPDANAPDATVVDAYVPDAPVDAAGPDAWTCRAEVQTDPDNCGRCGHVCASGLCAAGVCLGEPVGHVVVIGHDFSSSHAGMARLLGNALALGDQPTVRVGWWPGGDQGTDAAARAAAVVGLAALPRQATHTILSAMPADASALASFDVVVVESQHGDGDALEAAAAVAAPALHAFLVAGGTVVVLEGEASTSDRFARGAALVDLGVPSAVTGQTAIVLAPADAVAQQVPIPYLAETTSVGFAVAQGAVVLAAGGLTVVVHRTVQ